MQGREKPKQEFNCPKINDDYDYNWGYVATTGSLLFGSSVRAQETFIVKGEGPGMTTPVLIMLRIATRC